jgi:type VI secretion system secreted protein VgrG
MRNKCSGTTAVLTFTVFAALLCAPCPGQATSILGTADSFTVLAGSTVTNTGTTTIQGNVGVSPGSAVTGFPPGIVTPPGTIYATDAVAAQAQSDNTTAYNSLAGMPSNFNLTGKDLGGLTLTPGVYHFDNSAQLTGLLTLDAQGANNAFWVFQIGSTLTTASSSAINFINPGSNNGSDAGLFWQVGSSATLGTTTAFEGNILALTSITLNTGVTDPNGRFLAQNGAVTLDTNVLSNVCPLGVYGNGGPGLNGALEFDTTGKVVPVPGAPAPAPAPVPEPGTVLLLCVGMISLFASRKRLSTNCRRNKDAVL